MFEKLGNFSKMLQGASSMLPKIQALKDNLARQSVEVTSSDRTITVRMSGTGIVQSITIEPGTPPQPNSENIVEAVNAAVAKAKKLHLDAVHEAVKDLPIPGIEKIIAQLAE